MGFCNLNLKKLYSDWHIKNFIKFNKGILQIALKISETFFIIKTYILLKSNIKL
jgi:hypothetical protein